MESKKIVLSGTDASPVATITKAELMDIATTAISTTEAVTGWYGVIQRLAFFGGGMLLQNRRLGAGWNIIKPTIGG